QMRLLVVFAHVGNWSDGSCSTHPHELTLRPRSIGRHIKKRTTRRDCVLRGAIPRKIVQVGDHGHGLSADLQRIRIKTHGEERSEAREQQKSFGIARAIAVDESPSFATLQRSNGNLCSVPIYAVIVDSKQD